MIVELVMGAVVLALLAGRDRKAELSELVLFQGREVVGVAFFIAAPETAAPAFHSRFDPNATALESLQMIQAAGRTIVVGPSVDGAREVRAFAFEDPARAFVANNPTFDVVRV